MTFFIVICILVMVWAFIIGPFVRLIRVSRSWRQAAEQQRQRRSARQQQPPRPKKKIDPTVGEYVEFTETTVNRTETDGTATTISTETEQQITDITWEDLP